MILDQTVSPTVSQQERTRQTYAPMTWPLHAIAIANLVWYILQ